MRSQIPFVWLWIVGSVALSGAQLWAQMPIEDMPAQFPRLEQAINLAKANNFEQANDLVELAALEGADKTVVSQTRALIASLKADQLNALETQLQHRLAEQALPEARAILVQWIALGADQQAIEHYRERIRNIERYGAYEPGQRITDPWLEGEGSGPVLVVVGKGQFMMGSPESERGRASNEGPRHRVVIGAGFAVGQYEVTVGEFRAFIEATGHRTDAERRGRGPLYDPRTRRITEQSGVHWPLDFMGNRAPDNHPVIHVSWRDAQAYVAWLSEMTGHRYRLLSEAEFEFSLRAGTQSMYPWGQGMPQQVVENLAGQGDRSPTNTQWAVSFPGYADGHWGPAPVGTYEPNAFGLYDMAGNVMEWVEDCWHDSFVRAPADGAAWVNRGCAQRVVRGGSWAATPTLGRSAYRMAMGERLSDVRVGFRVARDLQP